MSEEEGLFVEEVKFCLFACLVVCFTLFVFMVCEVQVCAAGWIGWLLGWLVCLFVRLFACLVVCQCLFICWLFLCLFAFFVCLFAV